GAYGKNGERIYTWHGSISDVFSGKKITALYPSTVGAAPGHKRMWIGFSDGTIGYFVLPCVPNPANCDEYAYTTTNGKLYLPRAHFMFLGDYKALKAVTITGEDMNTDDYVQVGYR